MESVQKQLEEDIKHLRARLVRQEKKVKIINEKEGKLGEDRKRKPTALDNTPNKRIKSVVVTNKNEETEPQESKEAQDNLNGNTANRPNPASTKKRDERRNVGDKVRDKRLLANLLMGTLNQFKRSEEEHTRTSEQRKEVEKKIEEKESSKTINLLEQQKQDLVKEKQKLEEEATSIKEQIKAKEEQLLKLKVDKHEQQLSVFLKTKAFPPIYFFPNKTDEFTETVLGTKKPPPVPAKAPAEAPVVPQTTVYTDGDGVVVQEITRDPEEFTGVHPREDPSQDEEEAENTKKDV